MDVECFNKLSLDEQVKLAINSRDEETLDMIADSNSDSAKVFVARNISTSWETLEKLAYAKCRSVLDAVLDNPKAYPSTIAKAKARIARIANAH